VNGFWPARAISRGARGDRGAWLVYAGRRIGIAYYRCGAKRNMNNSGCAGEFFRPAKHEFETDSLMSTTLTDRLLRAAFSTLFALGVAGCSDAPKQDADPTNSAPVGSPQPTPTPAAAAATSASPTQPTATVEPGKVATQAMSPAGIDLAKLPMPKGATPFFASPDVAMIRTDAPAGATAKEVATLLSGEGWTPYGSVPGSQYFTKNLVKLNATVTTGADGKTMISYSAEKIAVDLPAMPEAVDLRYDDSQKRLMFDTKADKAGVENFYRELLGKSEWKATTDKPLKVDFKEELIFRNPKLDMLTLQMHEFEGKRRVTLQHMTGAEVAAQEARIKAALAQKKLDSEKPLPKLKLALPADASGTTKEKNRLSFSVPTGKAKSIVDGWRKTLTADGWKEEVGAYSAEAGSLVFRKDKQFVQVSHIDPGFIPGEITVAATEAELEY
jgi:hypothetical protein